MKRKIRNKSKNRTSKYSKLNLWTCGCNTFVLCHASNNNKNFIHRKHVTHLLILWEKHTQILRIFSFVWNAINISYMRTVVNRINGICNKMESKIKTSYLLLFCKAMFNVVISIDTIESYCTMWSKTKKYVPMVLEPSDAVQFPIIIILKCWN